MLFFIHVVNCFQISIFAVHEQQKKKVAAKKKVVNCFQISIFAVHEQHTMTVKFGAIVVNCFQISIFAVHEQPPTITKRKSLGCELLSN